MLGKPDIGMTINGALGGLVGITAGCAFVSVGSSLIIGAIAGALIVFGVLLLDKLKLDDPVGALAVHGMGGIFGTLAVGLFAQDAIAPGTTGNGLFFGGGIRPARRPAHRRGCGRRGCVRCLARRLVRASRSRSACA